MKIKVLSDLHLEFGDLDYRYKFTGEDVIVLAGDIYTRGNHSKLISKIPRDVEVFMVAGNHEYYQGNFDRVNGALKDLQILYPNFHFLQDESITYMGVEFFGGTMYSDLTLYGPDPLVEIDIKYCINDFKWISKTYNPSNQYIHSRNWSIEDHKEANANFVKEYLGWMKRTEGCKRVVISHFAPTPQAIAAQYQMSKLNPYFIHNMEDYMGWEGIWIFGHVHTAFQGQVGDTRLICNPKGYGNYENRLFDDDLIVEI